MTTPKTIDLKCPSCESVFSSEIVDPTGTPDRKRTDFQVHGDGTPLMRYGIHLCEACGFAGSEASFAVTSYVSYEVRRRVQNELTPRVTSGALSTSERYEVAAQIATWDSAEARQVADLWLRAAWSCVDEGDVEAERYFRRQAAWRYEEALFTYDGVAGTERAVLTYLVGELWRRIGDIAQANEWFARVPDEVTDDVEQAWILRVATQQQFDPREWFA